MILGALISDRAIKVSNLAKVISSEFEGKIPLNFQLTLSFLFLLGKIDYIKDKDAIVLSSDFFSNEKRQQLRTSRA